MSDEFLDTADDIAAIVQIALDTFVEDLQLTDTGLELLKPSGITESEMSNLDIFGVVLVMAIMRYAKIRKWVIDKEESDEIPSDENPFLIH